MKLILYTLSLWLLLAMSVCAQVMNDPTAAKANRDWLEKAIVSGAKLPAGTLYIDGTAHAAMKVGCGCLVTDGPMPLSFESQTDAGPARWINQLGTGPVFRVSNGFVLANVGLIGDCQSAAVEIEGSTKIPTGRCHFSNVSFQNWRAAIATLPTPVENHADNSTAERCETHNCEVGMEFNNIQGFNWSIRDWRTNYLVPPAEWNKPTFERQVVVRIKSGGRVTLSGLVINAPRCTIFETHVCNTNCPYLICENFQRDLFDPAEHGENYLTLLDNRGGGKWIVDASGHIPLYHGFDKRRLFPQGVPSDCDINIPGVLVKRRATRKLEAK